MRKKVAVVTGATGFIGKSLCLSLLNDNFEVFGIGKNQSKFGILNKYPFFHGIILDFNQYNNISNVVGKKVDYFYHAAYKGVNGKDKDNWNIQLNNLNISCITICEASKLKCSKYIYIGSVDEFEINGKPDDSFRIPSHATIYATMKRSSEIVGKVIAYKNGINYVSGLLPLTYGEGNNTDMLVNTIIRKSINNEKIDLIQGNNYYDLIYIDEAINGLRAIAEKGKKYESYYIGHQKLKTFKEIVVIISNIINNKAPLNFGAYEDSNNVVDYSIIDKNKLKKDTNYVCNFDFKKSILKTKEWIESNNE